MSAAGLSSSSSSSSSSPSSVNHLVVIGGGPAGCGMLCCAATTNRLPGLLDRGLVLLDANSDPALLGGGAFAGYGALRSNSHGCAFHESFPALGLTPHDSALDVHEVIPLAGLHKSMCQIGGHLKTLIDAHPRSSVQLGARAVEIREIPAATPAARTYEVVYEVDAPSAASATAASPGNPTSACAPANKKRVKKSVYAYNVCLCTGGQPKVPRRFTTTCGSKAQRAFDYLRGVRTKPALRDDGTVPSVAIVGYSHTAFSMALQWRKWYGNDAKITFVTRGTTMPRIYFPSQAEAQAIGYQYDRETDVCHATDRVFRFSGLRGDQRDFVLSDDYAKTTSTVVLDKQSGGGGSSGGSRGAFDESKYDHVIVATGFEMNEDVVIKGLDGAVLVPRTLDNGTFVSATGRLFAGHQVFAFGLGAGLLPTEELGGESSSRTKVRSDGVWLYQNTVGETILDAVA